MSKRDEHELRTIVLEQVLDLNTAVPLAENLMAHRGSDIVIDAGEVARLGAQSLQVLLSAVATWQADGRMLDFAQPSAAFIESLQLFGINADSLLLQPPQAD
jgi:chemotaxis protein CheX